MNACLLRILVLAFAAVTAGHAAPAPAAVATPDENTRTKLGLSPFYQKHLSSAGFPIVASSKVSDYALREAAFLIDQMLGRRDDIRAALIENKVRFAIMAVDELTTDLPEHSDLQPKEYWNRRARGLGATRVRPAVSCGEENLLGYPGDPYATENILIHEFAHAIHEMGLNTIDSNFDRRLQAAFDGARATGLWNGAYAAENRMEYWAEGVQSWFDTNRENDGQHNHVNTRGELKEYDPELAKLLIEVFGDGEWRYQRPELRRESGHLAGYEPARAPRFAWPVGLEATARKLIEPKGKPLLPVPMEAAPRATERTGPATTVTFRNETAADIDLYWLDQNGVRKPYGRLPSKGQQLQHTFSGHVWTASNVEGRPLGVWISGDEPGLAVIQP